MAITNDAAKIPCSKRVCCAAIATLAILWCLAGMASAQSLVEKTNRGVVELLTGPEAASVGMAQDLASVLDDGATRRVLPVVGRGYMQNLIDLKLLRGVDVAIIRTDALDLARKEPPVPGLADSLTYITKLYSEQLHVLAPIYMRGVADLQGKRVSFEDTAVPLGSAVFGLLGIKVEATTDNVLTGIQKLKKREVSAFVAVGLKPMSEFGSLGRTDGLHFLPISFTKDIPSAYIKTQLTAEDYPELVPEYASVDSIAVSTFLFAAPLSSKSARYRNVASFVGALFAQVPRLQEARTHSKWKEVDPNAVLPDWKRFPPAEAWLQRNAVASSTPPSEQELREAFAKFLDKRSRLSGAGTMSDAEIDKTFNLFQEWLKGQTR